MMSDIQWALAHDLPSTELVPMLNNAPDLESFLETARGAGYRVEPV